MVRNLFLLVLLFVPMGCKDKKPEQCVKLDACCQSLRPMFQSGQLNPSARKVFPQSCPASDKEYACRTDWARLKRSLRMMTETPRPPPEPANCL
jgi:hypothetical protein